MTVVAKYRTRWWLWWIVLSTMLIRTGEEIKEYKDAWTQSRLWWKRFSSNQNDHGHDCWKVFSLNITEINTTASTMLMSSGSVASFKGVTSNGGQTCGMGKWKKRGFKARICQLADIFYPGSLQRTHQPQKPFFLLLFLHSPVSIILSSSFQKGAFIASFQTEAFLLPAIDSFQRRRCLLC